MNIGDIISKIDISRLRRDYSIKPLIVSRNVLKTEWLTKEEFAYLYIELNLTGKELCLYLGCKIDKITAMCKKYNLYKPKQLVQKNIEKSIESKYGVKCVFSLSEIHEKGKDTSRKKYGCDYYSQTEESKQRYIDTCQEKYGVDNVSQLDSIKEKIKKTTVEHLGVEFPLRNSQVKEKMQNTCIKTYGVDNPAKAKQSKEKMKETNLKKHGKEYFTQTEDWKIKTNNTCQRIYKKDYFVQTDEFQDKSSETCLKKYGVKNVYQSPEIQKQMHQTSFERYGTIYYTQTNEYKKRCFETKKKNNSLGKSKEEDKIFEILLTKFPNTIHHPEPNEKYPFQCDFYIPELDLYIEYQGFKSHGSEPYDPNNTEHIKLIEEYKKKAEEINFKGEKKSQYLRYIETWTKEDPLKRETARKNKLNWIEFFNMNQFMDWFNKQ